MAEVTQALQIKEGDQRREVLRLRLGQGFDLSRHAPMLGTRSSEGQDGPLLRDTFARLTTSAGGVPAGPTTADDPPAGPGGKTTAGGAGSLCRGL